MYDQMKCRCKLSTRKLVPFELNSPHSYRHKKIPIKDKIKSHITNYYFQCLFKINLYSLEIWTSNPSVRTNIIYMSSLFLWRVGEGGVLGTKVKTVTSNWQKEAIPITTPHPQVKANRILTFVHDNYKILLLHCTITHIAMQEYFAKGDVIGLFTHFIFISEMNLN